MATYSKYTDNELKIAYNQLIQLIAVRAGMGDQICDINKKAHALIVIEIQKRGITCKN
jgi:hypothetical protein